MPSAGRRTYEEIKQRVLDGRLAVRTRIDVEVLARDLGVSSMPVRQALSLLTWERLVRPGERSGYEVALWSGRELSNLYEWRGALLMLALPSSAAGSELKRTARTLPYAQAVTGVMRLLDGAANPNLSRAAANADDRLHQARLVEPEVFGDVQQEFETLVSAIAEKSRRTTTLIKSYQRRRIQGAEALRERVALRALPHNGEPR